MRGTKQFWHNRRLEVFKRYGDKCQACRLRIATDIAHIEALGMGRSRYIEHELNDIDNLLPLCRLCHTKFDTGKLIFIPSEKGGRFRNAE